jgi:hypothetical protein
MSVEDVCEPTLATVKDRAPLRFSNPYGRGVS